MCRAGGGRRAGGREMGAVSRGDYHARGPGRVYGRGIYQL